MEMVSLIVAHDENRVIGKDNELIWNLPADLKYFKEVTDDKIVLMGRKTYESILAKLAKPLPNRKNIVLTSNLPKGMDVYSTLVNGEQVVFVKDADIALSLYRTSNFFIIGGESIYRQFIHLAETIYITEVHAELEGDAYFPEIDYIEYEEVSTTYREADEKNKYDMTFRIFNRLY